MRYTIAMVLAYILCAWFTFTSFSLVTNELYMLIMGSQGVLIGLFAFFIAGSCFFIGFTMQKARKTMKSDQKELIRLQKGLPSDLIAGNTFMQSEGEKQV